MQNASTALGSSDTRQIIKDSFRYLSANIVAQTVGLIRVVVIPILLNPAQLGIWNLMNVIIGYGSNIHMGLLHGMNKILPSLRSSKNAADSDVLKDSVFWITLLLGGVAGIVLFTISFTGYSHYAIALRIVSGIIFFQLLFIYFVCLLRADSNFKLVSYGVAALSILSTILVSFLAYVSADHLHGALWGLLAAHVIVVGYWLITAGYNFKYKIHFESISSSFSLGIPLIILALVDGVFLSIDRWVIVSKMGTTMLGYYAIGIMVSNLLGLVTVSIANVLFPRMIALSSSGRNPVAARGLLLGPLNVVGLLMLIPICLVTTWLPPIIYLLLPKYIPSLQLIGILVPASFFLSLAVIAGSYVVAINRQGLLFAVQALASGVSLLLDYWFIALGYGIRGVAYGTFAGYCTYGLGYAAVAVYLATREKSKTATFLLRLVGPFAMLLLILLLANRSGATVSAKPGSVPLAMIQSILMAILLFPVLWLSYRKMPELQVLRAELLRLF